MNRARMLVVLASVIPAAALAEPQVTPQDIIDHFTSGQAAPPAGEQRMRGVVIPEQPQGDARSVFIGAAGFGEAGGPETQSAARTSPDDAESMGQTAGANTPSGMAGDPGAYDLLIEFDLDSAALRAEARRHLDAFVEALHSPALSGYLFFVEGHTDSTGPAPYNLELSRRRAAAVVDYLVGRGIDPERLKARGFGETRPRTADPENAANRRVETRLSQ
ncbi:MAG TPA: OmpA family protein [Paracoccaceae bacterium]|nr:OmpA family protein [Paracoccaceae bacterium]